MIELAIFGSMVLLVLGALINYGITADLKQRTMMRSYRQALVTTANSQLDGTPTATSHIVSEERHVPSPTHPFGIGSFLPASGGARSPVRSYKLPLAPESESELPRTYFTVQQQDLPCPKIGSGCVESGFRDEGSVDGFMDKDGKWINDPDRVDPLDRYQEIFGAANTLEQGPGGCATCRHVRIVDPCEGEMLSYDGCYRQAVQISDPEVCARECFRGRPPGSTVDCHAVCAQPISIPWYAQGGFKASNGLWVFPALNQFFADLVALGPQQDYVKKNTIDTDLSQSQTPARFQTNSTIRRWFDQTTSEFVHRTYGDTTGKPARRPVTTTQKDAQSQTTTWTTP